MTRDGNRDRVDVEAVVRQALQAQADEVGIAPDALTRIRGRTTRQRRVWTLSLATLATAATASVVALIIALTGGTPPPGPDPQPVFPATQLPAATLRLPIYYAGQARGAAVLYREFHPAEPTAAGPAGQSGAPEAALAERIRAAVEVMLTEPPFDPNYHSDWPAGVSVRSVSIDAGTGGKGVAVVDLAGPMPSGTAGATALQQLVFTVTAVAADQDVQMAGVMVRHDGADWSDAPLTRAPALETLAPVWLISPQQGDTVSTTVDVHVAGVLGDHVRLRVSYAAGAKISDQAVTIVASTPASGSTGTASRGEAHVPIALAPGHYTIVAYVSSTGREAPDGQTLNGATSTAAVDDHTIWVGPTSAPGTR